MELIFKFKQSNLTNLMQSVQPQTKLMDNSCQHEDSTKGSVGSQQSQSDILKEGQQTSNVESQTSNNQGSKESKSQKKKKKKKEKLLKQQDDISKSQSANKTNKDSNNKVTVGNGDSDESEEDQDGVIEKGLNKNMNSKIIQDQTSNKQSTKKEEINNQSQLVSQQRPRDQDEFFQILPRVSQKVKKSSLKQPANKNSVKDIKNAINIDRFGKNGTDEQTGSSIQLQSLVAGLNDYINEKANRKLNKQEKKFIRNRVSQWQDYEKNVKFGHLGFNRREQSQINAQIIIDKCLEVNFDDLKYQEWFKKESQWDVFVAQNVEKKPQFSYRNRSDSEENTSHPTNTQSYQYWSQKCRKCHQQTTNDGDSDSDNQILDEHDPCCPQYHRSLQKDQGAWCIQKTEGQKHNQRIRKLCAVKRNEAFEEKYEETREEREIRQHEADRKRRMIVEQFRLIHHDSKNQPKLPYKYNNHQSTNSTSLSDQPSSPNKIQKQYEKQLKERQIRQLCIMNGIRDPEALNELMDTNQNAAGKSEVTAGRVQQKLKYVYSSDEYISGSSDDEIEEEDKGYGADNASHMAKSQENLNNQTFNKMKISQLNINSINENKNVDQSSHRQLPTEPLDYKSQKNLEMQWFGKQNNFKQTEESKINEKGDEPQKWNSLSGQIISADATRQLSLISTGMLTKQTSKTSSELSNNLSTNKDNSVSSNRPPNYKTVLCKWFEMYGKCTYVGCTFAHGQKELSFKRRQFQPQKTPSSQGKTNLQQNEQNQYNDEEANYADQEYDDEEYYYEQEFDQQQSADNYNKTINDIKRHPKYKTMMCRNMEEHGACNYVGCTFAHSIEELRKVPKNIREQTVPANVLGILPYETELL